MSLKDLIEKASTSNEENVKANINDLIQESVLSEIVHEHRSEIPLFFSLILNLIGKYELYKDENFRFSLANSKLFEIMMHDDAYSGFVHFLKKIVEYHNESVIENQKIEDLNARVDQLKKFEEEISEETLAISTTIRNVILENAQIVDERKLLIERLTKEIEINKNASIKLEQSFEDRLKEMKHDNNRIEEKIQDTTDNVNKLKHKTLLSQESIKNIQYNVKKWSEELLNLKKIKEEEAQKMIENKREVDAMREIILRMQKTIDNSEKNQKAITIFAELKQELRNKEEQIFRIEKDVLNKIEEVEKSVEASKLEENNRSSNMKQELFDLLKEQNNKIEKLQTSFKLKTEELLKSSSDFSKENRMHLQQNLKELKDTIENRFSTNDFFRESLMKDVKGISEDVSELFTINNKNKQENDKINSDLQKRIQANEEAIKLKETVFKNFEESFLNRIKSLTNKNNDFKHEISEIKSDIREKFELESQVRISTSEHLKKKLEAMQKELTKERENVDGIKGTVLRQESQLIKFESYSDRFSQLNDIVKKNNESFREKLVSLSTEIREDLMKIILKNSIDFTNKVDSTVSKQEKQNTEIAGKIEKMESYFQQESLKFQQRYEKIEQQLRNFEYNEEELNKILRENEKEIADVVTKIRAQEKSINNLYEKSSQLKQQNAKLFKKTEELGISLNSSIKKITNLVDRTMIMERNMKKQKNRLKEDKIDMKLINYNVKQNKNAIKDLRQQIYKIVNEDKPKFIVKTEIKNYQTLLKKFYEKTL